MKNTWIALVGLAVVLMVAASCNKTSLLGSELFDADKLNLKFTDTLSVNVLNDAPTPVLMAVKGAVSYDNLCIGNVSDPYFGKTESSIYANFGTRGNSALPDFITTYAGVIDSVRLVLPYVASGTYGDTTATQKLSVYRLTTELKADTIYSSDGADKFPNAATALGSLTFKPNPNTPIRRIIDTLPGAKKIDTFVNIPHIRIPLDTNFGRQIMGLDSMAYKDTTGLGFHTWLKGLVIKAETPTNCMLQFNVGSTATTAPTGQTSLTAGIYIYYRSSKTDTLRKVYIFSTASQQRYANYKNDVQTGRIKDFVGVKPKSDSLIFLSSLGGATVRFEMPNLKSLGKIAVNRAEIEFTINDNADTANFKPLEQLLLLRGVAQIPNGNLGLLSSVLTMININNQAITDAQQSGYSATSFATIPDFGGYVVTENGVRKYKMVITQHIQKIIFGSEGTQVFVVPHFQYTKAGRVVLYGLSHSNVKYRPKVNLFYTKVD
jgi:hypothetical protein